MNKKLIIVSIILVTIAVLASYIAYQKGYDTGYEQGAQKGFEYGRCVGKGGPIGMSDPPQCFDDKGTHRAPSSTF